MVEELPVPPCPLDWPVIVKPAMQDASVGLDQGSVVTDQDSLNARVAYLLETYGPPVLVEQFIRGREFNVGVIEAPDLRVLPVSEILFIDTDPATGRSSPTTPSGSPARATTRRRRRCTRPR